MMSRCITLILFLLCAISATMAQSTAPTNQKAKLALYGSPDPLMVAISELKNTSIVFTSFESDQEGTILAREVREIPISEINYLRYPAKNSPAARAFVGGLVGFGIGGMIGLLMGDDDACTLPANANDGSVISALGYALGNAVCNSVRTTAGQKAVYLGVPLGIVGAIVGIASPTIKISINGKRENYYKNQDRIRNLME